MKIEITSILGFVLIAECGADHALLREWLRKDKHPVTMGSSVVGEKIDTAEIEFHNKYEKKE